MNNKLQAPKGGCYSTENHEWYDGGQFLPETCLPKGTIKKVRKATKRKGNIAELNVKMGFGNRPAVFARYAGEKEVVCLFTGEDVDEANNFVDALIQLKNQQYVEEGLMPHPTEVTKL